MSIPLPFRKPSARDRVLQEWIDERRREARMVVADTASATRSRTASPASRTGGASQRATIGTPGSSSRHAHWPPSSCFGYEP